MENDVLISVEQISKKYFISSNGESEDFYALKDVSFELKRNQSIGLIGKNGSGKSTLLKIIAGLVKPSSGQVKIYGKINPLIEVGSNFFPDLTGRENIREFLKVNHFTKDEYDDIISTVLEFSELGNYFDQPVKNYSAGMFVRLAVSAGFHIDADIFLIDEVLMAGDASFREKVSSHFNKILNKGAAVILASHNPEEIIETCSECFWLENGNVIERQNSKEALNNYYMQYANEYAEKRKDVVKFFQDNNTDKSLSFTEEERKELENDLLELLDFKIKTNKITPETPFEIEIKINKKTSEHTLHPVLKIYNVFSKPIMGIVSSNNEHMFKDLNELKSKTGKFTFSCVVPSGVLSVGVFYIDFMLIRDPERGIEYVEEAFKLPFKVNFEIEKGEKPDYGASSLEVFIKPDAKWSIQ